MLRSSPLESPWHTFGCRINHHDRFGVFEQFERTVMKAQFALIGREVILWPFPLEAAFGDVASFGDGSAHRIRSQPRRDSVQHLGQCRACRLGTAEAALD